MQHGADDAQHGLLPPHVEPQVVQRVHHGPEVRAVVDAGRVDRPASHRVREARGAALERELGPQARVRCRARQELVEGVVRALPFRLEDRPRAAAQVEELLVASKLKNEKALVSGEYSS
jgi:hypothetical protein